MHKGRRSSRRFDVHVRQRAKPRERALPSGRFSAYLLALHSQSATLGAAGFTTVSAFPLHSQSDARGARLGFKTATPSNTATPSFSIVIICSLRS